MTDQKGKMLYRLVDSPGCLLRLIAFSGTVPGTSLSVRINSTMWRRKGKRGILLS